MFNFNPSNNILQNYMRNAGTANTGMNPSPTNVSSQALPLFGANQVAGPTSPTFGASSPIAGSTFGAPPTSSPTFGANQVAGLSPQQNQNQNTQLMQRYMQLLGSNGGPMGQFNQQMKQFQPQQTQQMPQRPPMMGM